MIGGTDLTVEFVVWAVLAAALFLTLLAITVIAAQGYRRYDSRPMLFFALGFAFLLLTQVLVIPMNLLFETSAFVRQTSVQLVQLAGGLCILYAIRMEP